MDRANCCLMGKNNLCRKIRRRSGSRCRLLTQSKVKFENLWGFPFILIPSNFALIKEEVGGVAGYVGVLVV